MASPVLSIVTLWMVKSAFTSKRLDSLITGFVPSAALMVSATVGLSDDSVYSPSVRMRMSPAVALVTAVFSVPEPGATLTVAALISAAYVSTLKMVKICRLILN